MKLETLALVSNTFKSARCGHITNPEQPAKSAIKSSLILFAGDNDELKNTRESEHDRQIRRRAAFSAA
jgi:hypothetical protein